MRFLRRAAWALVGLALCLACGGLPPDTDGHSHFQRHEAELRSLCVEADELLGAHERVHVEVGPMPEALAPRLAAADVSAMTRWRRIPGVDFTIATSGLSVSGSSMSLFCGPSPPYPVVPDTHPQASAPGQPDGAFCTAVADGWWLCREWS